ncbi:reverse transcriptase domain-containing protein [Tanacetum coccineum]
MICGLFQNQASTSGTLLSNTIPNPKGEMKAVTTRSGVAYEGPSIPTNPSHKKVVERETEETTDKEQTNFQGSTAQIPPPVIPISIPKSDVPKSFPKTTPIPEPDVPKRVAPELLGFLITLGWQSHPSSEPLLPIRFGRNRSYLKDDSITPFQLPSMDLKQSEVTEAKSSIEEPPELELKDLPSHLEYAYLEENDKLPVIIAKDLKDDEKDALLKVLKSHKRAISWKITDIKGIDPHFCTHQILMEDDYKPMVQNQRWVNPKIHEVIKKEVLKLLDAGMIYPISDSPWVSPVHCVPMKGGITVVANEENELIPTRLVTRWRVCIDYRKLNEATRKDHFPLPFMDQISQVEVSNRGLKRILERTVGENRASWSDKLDDALWAFRTAFKKPIGCTPYKLVYGKSCHLPIELEHKAYWALKHANFDLKTAGDHRKLQLNELNEIRDQAYENSLIYKERTKKLHDSKIKNRIFNVGDRVLLFNSRLKIFSGKLKTHWSGPFTLTKVFPYGTIKLSQPDGPNFKVNGHRVKHYFGEDLPPKVVQDLHTFSKDE